MSSSFQPETDGGVFGTWPPVSLKLRGPGWDPRGKVRFEGGGAKQRVHVGVKSSIAWIWILELWEVAGHSWKGWIRLCPLGTGEPLKALGRKGPAGAQLWKGKWNGSQELNSVTCASPGPRTPAQYSTGPGIQIPAR